MSRGPWIDPTYRPEPDVLRGQVETDTVIVGAGLAGAWLASCLGQAEIDVVVLDAARASHGATGRSAGFVLADGSDSYCSVARTHGEGVADALRTLGVSSRDAIHRLAESHDFGYTQCGSVRLAVDEAELLDLRTTTDTIGDGLIWSPREGLPAPWCDDARFLGGSVDPADGALDPVRLVSALLEPVRAGARLFEESPVVQIKDAAGPRVVYTEHGHVVARRIVLCTNAWTRRLLPSVGPIQPVRAQMLEATVEPGVDWPMAVYARRGAEYWRDIGHGRVLVGGCRDVGGRAENVDVDEPTAPVQAALDKLLMSLLPEGADATVSRRWAGLMGFTPDGLPVAGEVPGHEEVFALCGFNGHGVGWAPALAERLAATLGGDDRALPAYFAPGRFAYPAR